MLLEHFPLSSLSLLHKISNGTLDAVKCAQILRNEAKISRDMCQCLIKCTNKNVVSIFCWRFGGP